MMTWPCRGTTQVRMPHPTHTPACPQNMPGFYLLSPSGVIASRNRSYPPLAGVGVGGVGGLGGGWATIRPRKGSRSPCRTIKQSGCGTLVPHSAKGRVWLPYLLGNKPLHLVPSLPELQPWTMVRGHRRNISLKEQLPSPTSGVLSLKQV